MTLSSLSEERSFSPRRDPTSAAHGERVRPDPGLLGVHVGSPGRACAGTAGLRPAAGRTRAADEGPAAARMEKRGVSVVTREPPSPPPERDRRASCGIPEDGDGDEEEDKDKGKDEDRDGDGPGPRPAPGAPPSGAGGAETGARPLSPVPCPLACGGGLRPSPGTETKLSEHPPRAGHSPKPHRCTVRRAREAVRQLFSRIRPMRCRTYF